MNQMVNAISLFTVMDIFIPLLVLDQGMARKTIWKTSTPPPVDTMVLTNSVPYRVNSIWIPQVGFREIKYPKEIEILYLLLF